MIPRAASMRRRWARIGLVWLCGLASLGPGLARGQVEARPGPPFAGQVMALPAVPAKVAPVLKALDETGKAPKGVLGGRVLENRANPGEQPLPKVDRDGDPITYHTWDVNPRDTEPDRGRERLVVGTDGSAYYTANFYRTFATVRNPARSSLAGVGAVAPPPPPPGPLKPGSNRNAPARPSEKAIVTLEPKLAARVIPVVDYIRAHQAPPPETVGGREYRNLGLEDGEILPRSDSNGRPIHYREWDVHPRVPGRNRGAERIITGSDGRVYYTNDHYANFQRIR